MPLYYFNCAECNRHTKKLLASKPKPDNVPECPECLTTMVRMSKPPTSQVLETLDNHLMPKRLERLVNAEELYKNRSKK